MPFFYVVIFTSFFLTYAKHMEYFAIIFSSLILYLKLALLLPFILKKKKKSFAYGFPFCVSYPSLKKLGCFSPNTIPKIHSSNSVSVSSYFHFILVFPILLSFLIHHLIDMLQELKFPSKKKITFIKPFTHIIPHYHCVKINK